MNILSLSTAEQGCSIALAQDNRLLFEEYWSSKVTHSKRLLAVIDGLFESRSPVPFEKIDAFIAAKGPGSFTGLRIGISTTQGMAYAAAKPCFGISSLDGIAWRFAGVTAPVCAMMDARRNQVYYCIYRFKGGRLVSKGVEKVSEPDNAVREAGDGAFFAGSGSKAYKEVIEKQVRDSVMSSRFQDDVSAAGLIQSFMDGEVFLSDPGNILVPNYIRKSDAQMQFAEK